MHQYVANRNVFRDCLRHFPPITRFRKLLFVYVFAIRRKIK